MGIDKTVYQDEYFLALPEKRKLLEELNKEPYIEHWKNLSLEDIEGEIWKDINGYEGLYKISNYERVKSLPRLSNRGNSTIPVKERIIKHHISKREKYREVGVSKGNQVVKKYKIHCLIALHFIHNRNPKKYKQVNHLNGNRGDNRIKNLEWVTRRQDLIHKYHILNYKFPDNRKGKNSKCAMKIIQKTKDDKFIKEWDSQGDIERATGYLQSCISRACNGGFVSYGFKWDFKK